MAKTSKKSRLKRPRAGHLAAAAVHGEAVCARIVQLRKDRGLSAAVVAATMGISRPFYTQLENGTRRMTLVYFLAICRVLLVEPGDLLK